MLGSHHGFLLPVERFLLWAHLDPYQQVCIVDQLKQPFRLSFHPEENLYQQAIGRDSFNSWRTWRKVVVKDSFRTKNEVCEGIQFFVASKKCSEG